MKDDIIINKLFCIQKHPEMYLGKKQISRLHMFISGYINRQCEIDITVPSEFDDFNEFVNQYYKAEMSASSWIYIILHYEKDEENSFDKFYELLDIYLKERRFYD